jgi:formate dehydrogenase major subunit
MDPLATETSEFWQNVGPFNDVKSAKIQTEVFRLPTTCFAEEDGSLVNSSRWLQWHWKGADGPGEAQTDIRIMSELFLRLRKRYQAEGKFPDPMLKLSWPTRSPTNLRPKNWPRKSTAAPGRLHRRQWRDGQGRRNWRLRPAQGRRQHRLRLLDLRRQLDRAGNQMARRDNADPYGMHQHLGWAWAWPANRRILYNRASATSRQAVGSEKRWCGGTARPGAAPTCRTSRPSRRKPG